MLNIKILILVLTLTIFSSCKGEKIVEKSTPFPRIKDVPASTWEKLSQKKIYFGHQSVGYNIIDGIKDVMKENPQIKLNIVETSNPADLNSGIFAHSTIGKNMDPKSKVDEFVTFMENGIGNKTDIVALKYCYVDVMKDSDVEKIFTDYVASISQLKMKYPGLIVIHYTVPLTSIQTGLKAWIKKIMGRAIDSIDDNIKRNEYNGMLLKRYEGKEPVFDLALIESTLPDGTRMSLIKDEKIYYSLVPAYTNDGGHLNERSRKIVAEQFLIFLSKLMN
jgi:hypothetical protein